MPATTDRTDIEPDSYAAASRELDQLTQMLERGIDDVDALLVAAERATYLIGWCRDRIAGASARIQQLNANGSIAEAA